MPAFGMRGGDIDKNGVVWGSASSGHLVSFDRRKCRAQLNGPNATGNHCLEGGPGINIRVRVSMAWARTARSRAITPGSTSTTWSGLAKTSRYRRRI
jgi:hypothetical protein